jgi:Flp pilus assembly protein TadG
MLTRLVSCRRGVVSVEAALVFPVLILLVMGAMEFGLLIFTYSAMQSATREATRQVAVNFTAAGDVADAVAARLPQWSRAAAAVAVSQSAPADPATNVIRVVVTMPAGDATPVRFFTRIGEAWDLRTEAVMKQELPL